MMIKFAISSAMLLALYAVPAEAQRSTQVDGHVRRDGVYVAPHMRTTPNSTASDNWSTRGNVNPYTGRSGTVDPYAPKAPSWQSTPTTPRRRGY